MLMSTILPLCHPYRRKMPQLPVEDRRMEQQWESRVVSALRWCQCHRWVCVAPLDGPCRETHLYESMYIWLNADCSWKCPSSAIVPPHWTESVWTAKKLQVWFFNLLTWITWIRVTISDYLIALKGICKLCHDSKWIFFHSSAKAVTQVIWSWWL